ncbi:RHS repeat-associated core domain-containing protein [Gilliamella sp. GillExp13]|uniref:RHS repeat-associated core domain-containing protein n=1 Tax=Gilliamella sp. GillExp13 TaxID=3120243 RepID=UPI00080E6FDD|nr:RHS repeat-associated core domain-containing protein [Gilliamella apicola]OCG64072.1 hypothetical protein A9G37_07875 [Gilliamella apicola]
MNTKEIDDLEQIISEHNHGGRYQYQYDALGNLLTSTLPDGYQLHHLYYGAGHLSQLKLTTPDQHNYPLADYERDRLHREISRTQGALTQSQRFDNLGRMTQKYSCITELSNHAQPLIDKRFDYDRAGNLIGQANSYGNYPNRILNKSPRYSENYHYDSIQQITGLQTHYGQHHIAYDPAGNLLNDHREAIQHNRLTHYNGYYYRYDGFGRLIERRHPITQLTQQFFYNSQHQLIEARVNDIYHRSTTLYTYDALGRRTSKSTKHDDKYEKRQHHEQTNFFWQGMRLSGEQHSTQPDQRLHYIYNQDSYEPIARVMIETNPNTQSENVQLEYFHTQLNDLPTELTNEQGEMVWRGDYQLFGQLKQQQTSSPYIAAQNLRFAGQYYDKETGLHYNTFRYYDPNCGRFTQPDPIGLAGGINLYQYAPNTLTWVDPWGLFCGSHQKHHPIPQFLGGHKKQELITLAKDAHVYFHNKLNALLKKSFNMRGGVVKGVVAQIRKELWKETQAYRKKL